jgi:hypothetical protein
VSVRKDAGPRWRLSICALRRQGASFFAGRPLTQNPKASATLRTKRWRGREYVSNTGRKVGRRVGLAGGMLDWLRECFCRNSRVNPHAVGLAFWPQFGEGKFDDRPVVRVQEMGSRNEAWENKDTSHMPLMIPFSLAPGHWCVCISI